MFVLAHLHCGDTYARIAANISTDAGNTMVIGTDGGLYTPAPAAADPTAVEASDSQTVDVAVNGTGTTADPYIVTADVRLDPVPPGGGAE